MTTDRNSEGAVQPFGHIYRVVANDSESRPWRDREGIVFTVGPAADEGVQGYIEYLNLYTTPPASIPAAEVLALVEELNQEAAGFSDGDASARREIAQRLAKLIPRNPE